LRKQCLILITSGNFSCTICIETFFLYNLSIQRPRQRSPPIIPTKGGAACVCLYKRRGMADFHHHFLGGYRYCSSTKPRLRIDLGTKKGVPFTACRNSIWFDFYDCSKNASNEPRMGFFFFSFFLRHFSSPDVKLSSHASISMKFGTLVHYTNISCALIPVLQFFYRNITGF